MFRLQGPFSHVSSLIVQEPHAETTEVTTDHGLVLKTRHFSGYEQAKCLDISVVVLLGHYLLHNIDLQGFFLFTSDRFEHSAGR